MAAIHYQPPKRSSARRWFIIGFILLVVIAGFGIASRMHAESKLKKDTKANSVPIVSVIKAMPGPVEEEIVLPGSIQPWHDAILYARTNGFLKEWVRTMGMHVKQGELIATIETPEVDAQLRQAEADLKTAEANNVLAQSTAERWKKLLKTNSVSKQEADEKISQAMAQAAGFTSAQANRDRLKELESFKQVRAPFDGVISSRTTDVGQLVTSGSTTQQPLFHVVQDEYLRVYVRVPQSYSAQISDKIVAEVHFDEHPGQVYKASFVTTAEAIDTNSQTMLTEFKIDNHDHVLLAGGYAQVHLKLPAVSTNVRVPINTLLFRSEGPRVAVVDADNKAQLKPITIGRDFGTSVEITEGVVQGDQVIVNPSDSLVAGQPVRIATPAEKKEAEDKAANKDEKKEDKKDDSKKDEKK